MSKDVTSHELAMPTEISSERLILRPYRIEDAPAFLEVCVRNREHLLPYEAGNPALGVATLAQSEALLRRLVADWTTGRAFFLSAWERASGQFVAQIYVGVAARGPFPLKLEIGYFVDCQREGQGFVSEATRAVLEVAFTRLGAAAVRLECNELNARSRRVAERCGFRRTGYRARTHLNLPRPDGVPSGDLLYEVSATEWSRDQSRQKT